MKFVPSIEIFINLESKLFGSNYCRHVAACTEFRYSNDLVNQLLFIIREIYTINHIFKNLKFKLFESNYCGHVTAYTELGYSNDLVNYLLFMIREIYTINHNFFKPQIQII